LTAWRIHTISSGCGWRRFAISSAFSELSEQSRVLCVGPGTGSEMVYLAQRFSRFTFTAVEPSARMLEACRVRVHEHGLGDRFTFHHGFLASLPQAAAFDAATCLLVSQFLVEPSARIALFRSIAQNLRPGAILASTDLSADVESEPYPKLLAVWARAMANTSAPEDVERMRAAYARDVAVLPAQEVQNMIVAGGFDTPIPFFQAGLIHGWLSRRTAH
jgi:tRNA (cmo5U34)-methyltransferase